MIKLYGPPGSSAGRCYWTLEEVGAAYEVAPFSFRERDHKTPQFLAMNPNGKIPVMVDGDVVLWESMAIDLYLAEKFKPELLGEGLVHKAEVLKWSFWALVEYQKPMIDVFIQKVFVPEEKRSQEVIDKGVSQIQPLNKLLDEYLSQLTYMVGDSFSLADLHVASVAKINKAIGISLDDCPHLTRWLAASLERPAALRAQALES